jgi:trehalose 6-phosphate phosphatase
MTVDGAERGRTRLAVDDAGLFLDIDGTLVEFAEDPDAIRLATSLIVDLGHLSGRLRGALALVSGRPIAQVDALFAPLRLPVAGLHGFERRDADGRVYRRAMGTQLDSARAALRSAVGAVPGLRLEDKGFALAMHFRGARQQAARVAELVDSILPMLEPDFERLDGDCVIEIKPSTHNKGSAVMGYMREAPFSGRLPVFVGDDVTDADAFAAVRRLGGTSIAVGERVVGQHHLADPAAVRRWIHDLVEARDVWP